MHRAAAPRPVLLAVGLALLVGCGGGTGDPVVTPSPGPVGPSPTASPTTAPTPSPSPTSAAAVTVLWSTGDGSDCGEVTGFERPLPEGVDPIEGAFDALVGGPDADEVAAGASSFFSPATAGTVLSATRQGDLLVVDLADLRAIIPNASTSCGSEALLAQLNGTAFQFPQVARARYEIEGDCDVFSGWLQRDCTTYER